MAVTTTISAMLPTVVTAAPVIRPLEHAVPHRWVIPVGAVLVHVCIGSVYAWSTFNRPIQALFPDAPWWFSPPYPTFTTALALLGLSAAFGGPWVERRGHERDGPPPPARRFAACTRQRARRRGRRRPRLHPHPAATWCLPECPAVPRPGRLRPESRASARGSRC